MKTILPILISFILAQTLQAQFTIIPTSTTEHLNDVDFINPQTGFAVGENGSMVKTIDGGDTWTILNLNTADDLKKVQFLDASTGFVISDSILFKTVDGGMTFTAKVFSEQLYDLHFTSTTDGKLVGHTNLGAYVLSTSDGGDNFSNITIGSSWYAWDSLNGIGVGDYYTLHCISYSNGHWEIGGSHYDYNGGDYPYAYYSTNGSQWTERYLDLNLPYGDADAAILDIQTTGNGDVYHLKKAQSDKTYLYKNGWKTLLAQPNVYFNKMAEFGILNDSTLLIPTNGKLRIYDTDSSSGQVTEQNVGAIVLTGGVGMVNSSIGFFTGENGKLLKYTDLMSSTHSSFSNSFSFFPNPVGDYLTINSSFNLQSIHVLDVNGRMVLNEFNIHPSRINVSQLETGVYFIRLQINDNMSVQKFVKW